jgi:hypothetical protein
MNYNQSRGLRNTIMQAFVIRVTRLPSFPYRPVMLVPHCVVDLHVHRPYGSGRRRRHAQVRSPRNAAPHVTEAYSNTPILPKRQLYFTLKLCATCSALIARNMLHFIHPLHFYGNPASSLCLASRARPAHRQNTRPYNRASFPHPLPLPTERNKTSISTTRLPRKVGQTVIYSLRDL